ncbi:MAG: hypothetical protein ILP16_01925 [Spirochaetales bacterium]|nr:hypothetical protein [Spirochaetales bacterium]
MEDERKKEKLQLEDKKRCAGILLEMIVKYGAEILEEAKSGDSKSTSQEI